LTSTEFSRFEQIDILDIQAVRNLFQKYNFHTIIHLAANKSIVESKLRPAQYTEVNEFGTENLAKLGVEFHISHFIFASSAAVYGVPTQFPVTENQICKPISLYGTNKLNSEKLLRKISKNHFRVTNLRFFNVAGSIIPGLPKRDDSSLFAKLSRCLSNEETLEIYGNAFNTADGTSVRDYVFIQDLVEAISRLLSIETEPCETLNFGSGVATSTLEVIAEFENQSRRKITKEYKEARDGEIPFIVSSMEKTTRKLDFVPRATISEMVRTCTRSLDS
jgi:UDP-glucose 4-epimerase